MPKTFKANEIDIGYHPSGFKIDKNAPPLDRYTQWNINEDGIWYNKKPVCFHALPDQGWIKYEDSATLD